MNSGLLRGLSASALLAVTFTLLPAPQFLTAPAQAQVRMSASIDFGTFYTGLSPHGTWTSLNNQYVWVPNDVDARWRPYSRGHWVATEEYGWVWVSNERFGWATYHYGRWGYDDAIGWYWVPGHRWAPAWVAWSRNDEDVAWAPLPPRTNDRTSVSVKINIGDVPDYYWQAVPARAFLSLNFSNDFISDRNRVHSVVQNGQPRTVVIQNNIVVNNAIDPTFIEERTGSKIDRVKVDLATSPDQVTKPNTGKADTITIFNGEVKGQPDAKPQGVKPPDQIANDRKAKGVQPLDKSGQDAGTSPQQDKTTTPPATGTENGNTTVVPKQNSDTNIGAAKPKSESTTKTDQNGNTATDQNVTPSKPPLTTDQKPADKNRTVPLAPGDNTNSGEANQQPPSKKPHAKQPPAVNGETQKNGADTKVKPAEPNPPAATQAPDTKAKAPAAPPPVQPKAEQKSAPQAEPPKAQPPKAEPPKAEPPKAAPLKPEPPKAEPPKAEPPKAEPPKAEPPKAQPEAKPKASCDPQKEKCD